MYRKEIYLVNPKSHVFSDLADDEKQVSDPSLQWVQMKSGF